MRGYGIALSDPVRVEKLMRVFKGQDKPYVSDEHFYRGGKQMSGFGRIWDVPPPRLYAKLLLPLPYTPGLTHTI